MKPILFTPADSVEMYESGKFVLVGIFDTVNYAKLPIVLRPFGLAVKVKAEKGEYGKAYDVQITLRKVGARKFLFEATIRLKFAKRPPLGVSLSAAVLHLPPIKFDAAGVYVFELKRGSKIFCTTEMYVVKTQQPKKKKK